MNYSRASNESSYKNFRFLRRYTTFESMIYTILYLFLLVIEINLPLSPEAGLAQVKDFVYWAIGIGSYRTSCRPCFTQRVEQ